MTVTDWIIGKLVLEFLPENVPISESSSFYLALSSESNNTTVFDIIEYNNKVLYLKIKISTKIKDKTNI